MTDWDFHCAIVEYERNEVKLEEITDDLQNILLAAERKAERAECYLKMQLKLQKKLLTAETRRLPSHYHHAAAHVYTNHAVRARLVQENLKRGDDNVEKFAEKNRCKTFHCFADESYHEHIKGLNVLEDYTIKNCWPYWDKFEQRVPYNEPSLAADGEHYGAEHHERFAQLFLGRFGTKLK